MRQASACRSTLPDLTSPHLRPLSPRAGLLHFGTKLTDDMCLYPEAFTFKVVNDTGSLTPQTQGRVTTGLEYYFGAFGSTVTLDEIISQVRSCSAGPHHHGKVGCAPPSPLPGLADTPYLCMCACWGPGWMSVLQRCAASSGYPSTAPLVARNFPHGSLALLPCVMPTAA